VSQRDRILRALRNAGDRGVTQVDFLGFPAVDGGAPITRVAARIEELRKEGHPIVNVGTRDKCAIYRLATPTVAPTPILDGPGRAAPNPSVGGQLGVGGLTPAPSEHRRPAIFDDWEDAA